MRTLLQRWLDHYDPIHRGLTCAGIANGIIQTNGFFFPRIDGGYNLRRDMGAVPDADSPIVGAAGADVATIHTFPWVTHAADTTYVYRITPINGGGAENMTDEVVCEVGFDSQDSWIGLRPNAPCDLRVTALCAGRFRLEWMYLREGEQAEPMEFHVYHNGGSGQVDFSQVVGIVPYRRGRLHYDYTSDSFEHDTRVRWAVRAVSAAGTEETNAVVTSGRSIAHAPPANPAVAIAPVEDF